MDRRGTLIAGIIGTGTPLQSAMFAHAENAPHTWRDSLVTYNVVISAIIATVTFVLLVRRAAMHAYRDWLSIRAARKAARKLEQDIEVIARRAETEAAAASAAVTLETIHPPKPE